ncbi:iron-siderophore ABC transporter substrate-binding protein [Brevibacillus humidisoli]|uniref:ABC transporter substrate-binding protein n=1 Tax=Brevibacillus humidisoli TaxID=2895522 RepID=UPI001E2C6D32|nr:iron-siderophore ABC transporter substrate-binding protein [Brevibacillus humidisoli]UFJ42931.1 iron-siderophore ABC transporter substrate-binding protein [Brevibacillus humidisoli]
MKKQTKTWTTLLLALFFGITVLAGCGGQAGQDSSTSGSAAGESGTQTQQMENTGQEQRTFQTPNGEFTITGVPKRVVGLSIQSLDSMVALGIEPVGMALPPTGVPEYLQEGLKNSTSVGDRREPNLETILSLEPDLIVVEDNYAGPIMDELKKIAPTISFRANSWQEAMEHHVLLGDILGKKDEAEAFVRDFEAKLDEVKQKTPGGVSALGMFLIGDAYSMWLDNSFVGSILTSLGADYALKQSMLTGEEMTEENKEYASESRFVKLNLEKLIELNPQVLFLMSKKDDLISEKMNGNPVWSKLDAVQNERTYEVDRNIWSRGRGPLAAKLIVEQAPSLLYPDVFKK